MAKSIRLVNVDYIVTSDNTTIDLKNLNASSGNSGPGVKADGHSASANTLLISSHNGTAGALNYVGFDSSSSIAEWGTFGVTGHSFDCFSSGNYYYKFGGNIGSGSYHDTVNKRLFASGANSETSPALNAGKYNPDGASSSVYGIIIGGTQVHAQKRLFSNDSVDNGWGNVSNTLAGQWGASDGEYAMFGEGYYSNDVHEQSVFKLAFLGGFNQSTWRNLTYDTGRNRNTLSDASHAFVCGNYHKNSSGHWAYFADIHRHSWSDAANDLSWTSLVSADNNAGAGSNGNGLGILGGGASNGLQQIGMQSQGTNGTWGHLTSGRRNSAGASGNG